MIRIMRSYSELRRLKTFKERFQYLNLQGYVGDATFGYDRHLNQRFYNTTQWRQLRHAVIIRDNGCDLGIEGYEIHNRPLIHHMNPMTVSDLVHGDERVLNPEFLITTTYKTHNAIHFGDERLLSTPFVERKVGDTQLWQPRKEAL